MEIKLSEKKGKGTIYFDIIAISNWDLENMYRLLEAEKERANWVCGFFRGCSALLIKLRELAKQYKWEKSKTYSD